MATNFTVLLLSCALSTSAWGQNAPQPQNATALTREMSNRLQLNEGQYVRLLSLNRTRLTRQHEIEVATPTDLAGRTAQLAELQSQFEQECGRIMSPSQLSQLQGQPASQPTEGGNG